MPRQTHNEPAPSLTGALNRWVGMIACLLLAGFCAFQALETDGYSRAIDLDGRTVEGVVIQQELRPCSFGDFCYRRRRPDLTHVGHVVIGYSGDDGVRRQARHAINNETARFYARGKVVPVTYPVGEPTNATIGDPGFNQRKRLLIKLLLSFAAVILVGAALWLHSLPESELADG